MDTNDFNLFDLPEEILLRIFGHFKKFNDTDLLSAANVCERFRAAAKDAFSNKYNGDPDDDDSFYHITESSKNYAGDKELYRPFFDMFATHMAAIKIQFCEYTEINDTHWLVEQLINKQGPDTLRKLKIENGASSNLSCMVPLFENLTHLTLDGLKINVHWFWANNRFPHLTHLYVKSLKDLNQQHLGQFIERNSQLQHLSLSDCNSLTLNVFEVLSFSELHSVSLCSTTVDNDIFVSNLTVIEMHRLESLLLTSDEISSLVLLLKAIRKGSKNIRTICINSNWNIVLDEEVGDDFTESICLFNNLKTFKITDFYVNVEHIKTLLRRLSNIKSLTVCINKPLNNDNILSIASISNCIKKITLLVINWRLNMRCELNNSHFHDQFTDAVYQNHNNDLQLEISGLFSYDKIVITREMIVGNRGIINWAGAKFLENETHSLLNLNDDCLVKIINFLDINDQCALYQTCKTANKLVQELISSQCKQRRFTVDLGDIRNEEEIFSHFGKHITFIRLQSEEPLDEDNELLQFWNIFTKYCGSHIIEMIIDVKFDYELLFDSISSNLFFPKLEVLKIFEGILTLTTLSSFSCPKLWHLEITDVQKVYEDTFDIGGVFNNLTCLKLDFADGNAVVILKAMNNAACNKLKELTLNCNYWPLKAPDLARINLNIDLVNAIIRFRYLISLNLNIRGIERANTKYLFQNCSKLKTFSFLYFTGTNEKNAMEMLRHVKDNCNEIEILHIKSSLNETRFIRVASKLLPNVTIK